MVARFDIELILDGKTKSCIQAGLEEVLEDFLGTGKGTGDESSLPLLSSVQLSGISCSALVSSRDSEVALESGRYGQSSVMTVGVTGGKDGGKGFIYDSTEFM